MSPWLPLVVFVAVLNLLIFVIIRDRWGSITLLLLLAAIGGAVVGDLIGARTGLEPLRIGDVHVVTASIGAQLAMLVVVLLAALGPERTAQITPRRRSRSTGQRKPRATRPAADEDEEGPRIAGRGSRER
ncbi:MAG: hypothetical protein ABI534_11345 [Chloroflexota bacterium]